MELPGRMPLKKIEPRESTPNQKVLEDMRSRTLATKQDFDTFASDRRLAATQEISDDLIKTTFQVVVSAVDEVGYLIGDGDFKTPADVDSVVKILQAMESSLRLLGTVAEKIDLPKEIQEDCSRTALMINVIATDIRITLPL